MPKKIFALVVLCLSAYAYSASSEIPNQFHGLWASQEACRQINNAGIDAPLLIVNKLELNLPFSLCQLVSVKKSNTQSFLGQYTCRREKGETSKKFIEISLNDELKLSVKTEDNLKNLSICKIKNLGFDALGHDNF